MSDPSARTFSADFKRFFLRGLVVVLPSVLTLWIVVKAYQFVDGAIAEPINHGVRLSMAQGADYWKPLRDKFDPTPVEIDAATVATTGNLLSRDAVRVELRYANIQTWWKSHWYMNLIGLVVAVISVYIAGRLLGGFLGRRFYRKIERLITSLPVFKQVYPYVKQVVDFLFSDDKQVKFSRVVMIEYPRKGVWSLGFHTGCAMSSVQKQMGDSVTVFMPSSPTPFTGYAVNVPLDEVIELPITVEEAVRFIVSCGVLIPMRQQPSDAGDSMAANLAGLNRAELISIPADEDPVAAIAAKSLAGKHRHGEPRRHTPE